MATVATIVDARRLRRFVADILDALGVPAPDAELVAECLVQADLEGHGSHGVMRLPLYARRLRAGLIAARPRMRVLRNLPGTALLDATNALGPVAGQRAMRIATSKARLAGVGLCAVRRSNHLGSLSFYVRQAAAEGMLGMVYSNTPPAVAPPGGREAVLGTNPLAAAFPTTDDPVVIDMATSQTARGRILEAAQAGSAIPSGWALDTEGAPTTDADAALGGTLSPLGGAKGFALALAVEALSGVLSGAGVGAEVSGTYTDSDRESNVGHCFLAIDPDSFDAGFRQRMTALRAAIRGVAPIDAAVPVRVPGDAPLRRRREHEHSGIALPPSVVRALNAAAAEAGIAALA